MKKHRFSLELAACTAAVALATFACSVFEPPSGLKGKDSGVTNHPGAGGRDGGPVTASGSAGGATDTGGVGGRDAGMNTSAGGTGGGKGGGGAVGTSGGTGGTMNGNGGSDAALPSGPTDPWWPHKTAVGCDTAGVPKESDRPTKSDPGATVPPIYFAMNRFRLGAVDELPDPMNPALTIFKPNANAWKDIGFDLDGACTRSATCQVKEKLVDERACANSSGAVPFDGDQCIDNSIGELFVIATTAPSVGQWFGMSEPDWNCEMWRGGFSVILKVSNYNGEYNDDSVQVDLYTSVGLKSLPQWSCRTAIDQPLEVNWQAHAAWPQKEHWIISQDSIAKSADQIGTEVKDSQWRDPAAFVRGGWLVMHFSDGSWIWFDGERTPVPGFREIMHRSLVAAQLVHDPQSDLWRMDNGVWSFVARPTEMLDGFAQIGFCDNMCGSFDTVKNYLNTYQDTLSLDTSAPPDTPCDALSYGMVFRAAQVSADMNDVQPTKPFATCPQPRHPEAPRQGCVCSADRSKCTPPDGGT